MVEYAYKENGVMKLKPVAMSLSQSQIDEIATEVLEAMQPDWQNGVDITSTQINAGYTVPANGIFYCTYSKTTDGAVPFNVNGVQIQRMYGTQSSTQKPLTGTIIVNKGDVIQMNTSNINFSVSRFVPFKTINPVSLRPLDKTKIDASVVQHWDDITSGFSTAGSSAGFVLDYVKYNPVLEMLKIKTHKTSTIAAATTANLILTYNGSENITFRNDTTIWSMQHNALSNLSAGLEFSYTITASNSIKGNIYNRNSGNAWAAGDVYIGTLYL